MFCVNKGKGCQWQGEINELNRHLENSDMSGCQFENVKCSNGCSKVLERRGIVDHQQNQCLNHKITCKFCEDTGEYQFIEGQHKDHCLMIPLPCPNGCSHQSILRKDIAEHRETCQNEMIACSNDCGLTFKRRLLKRHSTKVCPNRMVECLYCHNMGCYVIQEEHKKHCPKFPTRCSNNGCNVQVPKDTLAEHMDSCPLKQIQCEYFNIGCKEIVTIKDQKKHNQMKVDEHLSLTIHILTSTQHELATTKQQLQQDLTVLATDFQKTLAKFAADFQSKIAKIEADAHQQIDELNGKLQKKTQQLERMQINQWGIELISNSTKLSFGNRTVPVIVKMTDFTKLKKDHTEWYSNHFYTHENGPGYEICLRVHASGWSKGCATHLSVCLCLLAGSSDDLMTWPFRGEFEVRLLNQISDSEHHAEIGTAYVTKRNYEKNPKIFWSRDQFICNERLQSVSITCQFFKNDTIFFEVNTRKLH